MTRNVMVRFEPKFNYYDNYQSRDHSKAKVTFSTD